ncbi:MAG: ABC transporter permease [Chloroflexota bacterium]
MTRYIIRRLIYSIPILLGVTILTYGMMTVAFPQGPVAAMSFSPKSTPAQRAKLTEQLGLNDPPVVQYFKWLGRVLQGDLGRSFAAKRNVSDLIWERASATVELGGLSLLLGVIIGVPIGIWAAVRQGSWFDNITRVASVIVSAIPIFWLGIILILIFGSWLNILPMGGRFPTNLSGEYTLWERIQHLILPVFVLTAGDIAVLSRYMRAATLEVSRQDYIRTAQAKGLSERVVWFTHAARNALIPLATFLGPALVGLLNGAIITETIFSWPGLGRLTYEAVTQLDYPVVMATVLIGAISTVFGYLLSDILYALIDPRIRYS